MPCVCQAPLGPHLCELAIIVQTAPQTQVGCVPHRSPQGPGHACPSSASCRSLPGHSATPRRHACTPQAPLQSAVLGAAVACYSHPLKRVHLTPLQVSGGLEDGVDPPSPARAADVQCVCLDR